MPKKVWLPSGKSGNRFGKRNNWYKDNIHLYVAVFGQVERSGWVGQIGIKRKERRAKEQVPSARQGRDEKHGVDVEMTGDAKSGFVITETDRNGASESRRLVPAWVASMLTTTYTNPLCVAT